MNLLRKLIRESVRKIILETTKHDSILAALPNLMLRYEETTDDEMHDITILDLFNGKDLIASATLTKLTGQLQGHPLRYKDSGDGNVEIIDQRYLGMTEEEREDAVGADEDGEVKYWHNAKCIPNTYAVSSIYTDRASQNRGIGDLMFDLIFYYCEAIAPLAPAGITTDFEGGNTAVINNVIASKINNPKNQGVYYKQVTKGRNDEMDFFGLTDDPDDDCYSELADELGAYFDVFFAGKSPKEAIDSMDVSIGTTSSWRKRGIQSMAGVWNALTSRTDNVYFDDYRIESDRRTGFDKAYTNSPTPEEIETYKRAKAERNKLSESKKKDPKVGTGKKPKGSGRRLYTDENPKDTVKVSFSSASAIRKTLSKKSFKSKSHKRQSQIINLIHQRVRAAYKNAKDPATKKRLKRAYEYAKKRKEASKRKTQRMRKKK